MPKRWPLLLGLVAALAACGTPGAPSWTADYFFPLDFPSVDLSGLPGGIIPVDTVDLPPTGGSQPVTGIVAEILQNDDLVALRAQLIVTTNLDVTGGADLSIATSTADLGDPTRSITVSVDIRNGADTVTVSVPLSLFRDADDLFFQADVLLAGQGGNIVVPDGARLDMRANFIGTIRVGG